MSDTFDRFFIMVVFVKGRLDEVANLQWHPDGPKTTPCEEIVQFQITLWSLGGFCMLLPPSIGSSSPVFVSTHGATFAKTESDFPGVLITFSYYTKKK